MAVFDNLNYSTSQGVKPGIIEFHERNLLKNMKPEMVHSRDAQKRTLPEGNGKYVNFRRMVPFGAVTEPLKEGVTPEGQELKQTAFAVMVKPYGRHVEITDELDMYHIDNLHLETNTLLSDQAALSLDTICRDAINAGLNVQYANGKATRGQLTESDVLTAAEIKKAVRTLKRNNCKPFADGFYHAIVHPDTIYDLTNDKQWVDVATYQDKDKIEKYELGCLYKVKFFESTNAKTFGANTYIVGTIANLTITDMDVATRTATISNTLTEDDARALTGKLVDVSSGSAVFPMCIERVDAANKKVVFRWASEDVADATKIQPTGAGASGITVHSTVIYGQDAYGDVELGGNGKNVKIIINPPGSAGAADPLEQRGSIAWKVKGFCCSILQDAFIVRVEHGATA
jgi:N4-gp56 family major capsid protein